MNGDRSDFQILTEAAAWGGSPENYNDLKSLLFKTDGTGETVIGYGQSVYAVITYRFEIPVAGLLRLTFVDSPSNRYSPPFREHGKPFFDSEMNKPKEISYELVEGDFQGDQNMGGTRKNGTQVVFTYKFRWALKFDRSPYPEGLELPGGKPVVFYGHGESGERVVGTEWMPVPRRAWWQFWK